MLQNRNYTNPLKAISTDYNQAKKKAKAYIMENCPSSNFLKAVAA